MEEGSDAKSFYKVEIVEAETSGKSVDNALIAFAKKFNAEVCTLDKGLQKKAEKQGVAVLYLGRYPKRTRKKR